MIKTTELLPPLSKKMFAEAEPDWNKKPDIKWNFTKFIIDREGNVTARFEPTAERTAVAACVKFLLGEKTAP